MQSYCKHMYYVTEMQEKENSLFFLAFLFFVKRWIFLQHTEPIMTFNFIEQEGAQ